MMRRVKSFTSWSRAKICGAFALFASTITWTPDWIINANINVTDSR